MTVGLVVLSALTVLSVYAAAARCGESAQASSPQARTPSRRSGWPDVLARSRHDARDGLRPLVVMSLGLLFRGARGWRHVLFLAVRLVGVAAAHSTSAIVIAVLIVVAPLVDLAFRLVRGGGTRAALLGWWSDGIVRPLAYAAGLGVCWAPASSAHLWLQGHALGAR